MKILLLLVFMVSCQQAEIESMLAESSPDVQNKVFVPSGDEIFDSFNIERDDASAVLASPGRHFKSACRYDGNQFYYTKVFISQTGESGSFYLTLRAFFGLDSACVSTDYNYQHNYKIKIDYSDYNRPLVTDYVWDLRVWGNDSVKVSFDDCDYGLSIVDSGCYFDLKRGGNSFEVVDYDHLIFNGEIYTRE